MGNQKNTAGKRVFDDVYSFPQDSQDLADDLWDVSLRRSGTSSERQSFPPGQIRAGLEWYETDTGATYVYTGTSWLLLNRTWERPWTTVTAATGWTAGSAPTNRAEVSLQGGTAFFRGALFGGTGGTTAATLPEWARPTRTIMKATFGSGGSRPPTFIRIWANGAFQPATSLNDETEIQWSVR